MSQKKLYKKIKKNILCSITYFGKLCRLWDVEKYHTTGQATADNITRLMRIEWRVTEATDTHSECVILYCFSTATMAMRTRLSFTFYVHCMSCTPFKGIILKDACSELTT